VKKKGGERPRPATVLGQEADRDPRARPRGVECGKERRKKTRGGLNLLISPRGYCRTHLKKHEKKEIRKRPAFVLLPVPSERKEEERGIGLHRRLRGGRGAAKKRRRSPSAAIAVSSMAGSR